MFKGILMLSDKGASQFTRSIILTVLENLSLILPFVVIIQLMRVFAGPLLTGNQLDIEKIWFLWAAGVAAMLVYIFLYKKAYRATYTSAFQESLTVRLRLAEHMRKLPLSFFNKKNLAELTTNLMEDCTTVERVMTHLIPQLIGYSISAAFACLMLSLYDWRMALAMFSPLPIAYAVSYLGRRLAEKASRNHVAVKLEASDEAQQFIDGIQVVKAFHIVDKQFEHIRSVLRLMLRYAIELEAIAGVFFSLAAIILQAGIGLVVLAGVHFLIKGSLDPLSLFLFVMISIRIYGPLLVVFTLLPEIDYLAISSERMRKALREKEMPGSIQANLTSFDIELHNVTFAYNQTPVIRSVSLSIPQGKTTALVGASGSGKSTLGKLIARFWDVDSGVITIGGKNIKEMDPDSLMRNISFVFQDVTLFNDTLMNNIRMGNPEATDEQVLLAARRARCDIFAEKLSHKYETIIGENGRTLSGGERQRVSIARALLKDASILLLDEATAALDAENEYYVQQALSELVYGRTVIVIAHRLQTIRAAHNIVVLDEGEIVEQGDFATLTAQNGVFAHMFSLQQRKISPLAYMKQVPQN